MGTETERWGRDAPHTPTLGFWGSLFFVVQSLNHVWFLVTPWTVAHQVPLSSTVSWSLLKSMSIELMMLSNHLILCCPLLHLPSVFPSINVFPNELAIRIRWPKCWNFSFSISPSSEYSGLIFFRIDWFDLFAAQGTFRVFSSTTIQKHQLFSNQPSLWVLFQLSSVQSLSHVQLFATPWTAACQASLSVTNSRSLLKLVSIESVMPSSHFVPYHPLLLLSVFPSIRVFSNESVLCIRWPKYWNFSISPSNEYSGLISFRIDWFDLLAAQGTLKSFLQLHRSKASIYQCRAFFTIQLSYPYMATGKTIALTRWTSVGKVMSLLFNRLSRFVIVFLPRSKNLLISWLQSP